MRVEPTKCRQKTLKQLVLGQCEVFMTGFKVISNIDDVVPSESI
jgi:hypothetical protein